MNDSEELLTMQKKVFMPLYIKYEDHETSPAKQAMDKFLRQFDIGDYYKIFCDSNLAGSVFVYEKEPGNLILFCQKNRIVIFMRKWDMLKVEKFRLLMIN